MKATEKVPEIENLLTRLSGSNRRTMIENRLCTWCKGSANNFKDSLSKKEYSISGFCQKCQDATFGSDDE